MAGSASAHLRQAPPQQPGIGPQMSRFPPVVVLPVVGSLVSPAALGKFISDTWTIPVRSCLLLNLNINDHYVIETDAASYIARVYGAAIGGPPEVAFELGFAEHAPQQGARVSFPLRRPEDLYAPPLAHQKGRA